MPTSTGSEIQKSSIMAGGQAASVLQRFSASLYSCGVSAPFSSTFLPAVLAALRWMYEITIDL